VSEISARFFASVGKILEMGHQMLLQASPLDRFLRLIRQMTRFCATKCLFIYFISHQSSTT